MKRKFFSGQAEELGPRTVRVIASTGAEDRTGEVVVPGGIDISGFIVNPIILWQHDPEHPIGIASNIAKIAGGLRMDIEFAPEGVSKKADEVCGLVKAGVLKGVSIGFDVIECEPMIAGSPKGPQRYLAIDLLEVSIVSIPANVDAAVVQRRHIPVVRRDGKRLGAATVAMIQNAMDHQDDAMAHHGSAMKSLQIAKDMLADLLASCEAEEKTAAPGCEQRQAVAHVLRGAENFWAYPAHLRGETPHHYAARAMHDWKKSRGLH